MGTSLQSSGGGRRRGRRQKQNLITNFDDAWRVLPLHRVAVFALPDGTGMLDVTVFIEDRLHHVPSYTPVAFHFRVGADVRNLEHHVQNEIAFRIAHMSWVDFEEPREE